MEKLEGAFTDGQKLGTEEEEERELVSRLSVSTRSS